MGWKERIKRISYIRLIVGGVVGAIAGYAYYYFVGCDNGTCAITSDRVNSTLYGSLIGFVFMYKEKKST